MKRERIIEILEAYRPGEGLESDPEVSQALRLATEDSELAEIRHQIQDFDKAFANHLQNIPVPNSLQDAILQAASARQKTVPFENSETRPSRNKVLAWFHPAAFAAAAAAIILLALSFTFWNRPTTSGAQLASTSSDLMKTAHTLYSSLRPSFKSKQGKEIIEFVSAKGGILPANLPGGANWDDSFACDVIEVNGSKVSIVCFKAPDQSNSMHLFTFPRSAFPDFFMTNGPKIQKEGNSCCASWMEGDQIHVLYSDKGEENLRTVLDI